MNFLSYFSSRESIRLIRSLFASISWRRLTKARMMAMLTEIAPLLFKTLDNIATPSSVKAIGAAPPKKLLDGITFCDTISSTSRDDSRNMKSTGKRSMFLFTCCFKARVSTLYKAARLKSSMTFFPLIRKIR